MVEDVNKLYCGDLCKLKREDFLEGEDSRYYSSNFRDVSHMIKGKVLSTYQDNVRISIIESKLTSFDRTSLKVNRKLLEKIHPIPVNPTFCLMYGPYF